MLSELVARFGSAIYEECMSRRQLRAEILSLYSGVSKNPNIVRVTNLRLQIAMNLKLIFNFLIIEYVFYTCLFAAMFVRENTPFGFISGIAVIKVLTNHSRLNVPESTKIQRNVGRGSWVDGKRWSQFKKNFNRF